MDGGDWWTGRIGWQPVHAGLRRSVLEKKLFWDIAEDVRHACFEFGEVLDPLSDPSIRIRLEDLLHQCKEPICNLCVGMACLETEPQNFVHKADVDEQPVKNVCDLGHVIRPPISVPDKAFDVLSDPALLLGAPQSHQQVRKPEVRTTGDVLGHHGESAHAVLSTDSVGLNGEMVQLPCMKLAQPAVQ